MPDSRLERTRRAYDRVIDLGPMGCKLLDVGTPDNRALNAVWDRRSDRSDQHAVAAEKSFARNNPVCRFARVFGVDEITTPMSKLRCD